VRQVAIIGAGMGGLATALRLRRHGFNVVVFEKQARPGGRSNLLAEQGFRADTGPTILVMKDTFVEFYRSLGHDLEARMPFRQIDPNYRIYFHDGTHLDLHSNMARLAAEVEGCPQERPSASFASLATVRASTSWPWTSSTATTPASPIWSTRLP
jgi:phytoene desaturase